MHVNSENYEVNDYGHPFGFANHLALVMCFKSYQKWVQSEEKQYRFQYTTLIDGIRATYSTIHQIVEMCLIHLDNVYRLNIDQILIQGGYHKVRESLHIRVVMWPWICDVYVNLSNRGVKMTGLIPQFGSMCSQTIDSKNNIKELELL